LTALKVQGSRFKEVVGCVLHIEIAGGTTVLPSASDNDGFLQNQGCLKSPFEKGGFMVISRAYAKSPSTRLEKRVE
jgi:hypothetical protein